jgi:non-heme Fe2+,alpha-ketoglutarate-dependent halogenase
MLSSAEITTDEQQGFITGVPVMSAEQAAGFLDMLEQFRQTHTADARHLLRSKSHLILTWTDEMMRHPRLLDAVSEMIGPDVLSWRTFFFIKDTGDKQFVSLHQDANYWGLDALDGLISAWIALTPSDADNGCMRIICGTHSRLLSHQETQNQNNMLSRGQTTQADDTEAVDIIEALGEVCLFHPLAVHGSRPNHSQRQRICFAMRYIVPERQQMKAEFDSVALVRGEDRYGHFEHEPRPAYDLAPEAVAVQERVLSHKYGGVYLKMRTGD